MGLSSNEGLELIGHGRHSLLCARRSRNQQHHFDVVGLIPEVIDVYEWCETVFGPPSCWVPLCEGSQWHNRFDTDVLLVHWTCLHPPWRGGGHIGKIHIVLQHDSAARFNDRWRKFQFYEIV